MTTPVQTSAAPAANATAAASAAQDFRLSQAVLSAGLTRNVVALWLGSLDTFRIRESWPAISAVLAQLVTGQHAVSASAGLQYFAQARLLAGLAPDVPVTSIAPPAAEAIAAVLDKAGPEGALWRIKSGQPVSDAVQHAGSDLGGAVTRMVLDGARQAVIRNVEADRQAVGWQRITSGQACGFCEMLADRGAYLSEDTADFSAHLHCSCTAAPVWTDAEAAALHPGDEWRRVTKGLSGKDARNKWRAYIEGGRS